MLSGGDGALLHARQVIGAQLGVVTSVSAWLRLDAWTCCPGARRESERTVYVCFFMLFSPPVLCSWFRLLSTEDATTVNECVMAL